MEGITEFNKQKINKRYLSRRSVDGDILICTRKKLKILLIILKAIWKMKQMLKIEEIQDLVEKGKRLMATKRKDVKSYIFFIEKKEIKLESKEIQLMQTGYRKRLLLMLKSKC